MALVEKITALAKRMGAQMKLLQALATNTANLSQIAGNAAAEALQTANATASTYDNYVQAVADCQKEIIRCADRTTKIELWAAKKFGYQIPADDE